MADDVMVSGACLTRQCSDLAHPARCRDNDERAITPDEAEMIEKQAEIFVDAMMRLQQRHGLKRPR